MHFAALPPEINSGRMYSGPGSESMILAAATWGELAAQLDNMAADYHSTTSKLARQRPAPAAGVMSQAAASQIRWLKMAASRAGHAAAQAKAATNAYESALAAMVPPAVIAANRTQRTSLAAANSLGQAGGAIADAEAEYEQMWAQDAAALYNYAAASAAACQMAPFTSPGQAPTGRGWTLKAAPDVISTGGQVMSAIPEALRGLSSSPLASFDASLAPVTSSLSKLSSLSAPSGLAVAHLNSMNKAAALRSLLPQSGAVSGATTSAYVGRAASVGMLSVPRAWMTSATPNQTYQGFYPGWVAEPIRLVAVSEPAVESDPPWNQRGVT
jgi:PPE-repeat protein